VSKTADTLEQAMALAGWARGVRRSALQEMLTDILRPGVLSFALGLPAVELFPAAAYGEALACVLAEDSGALQYGPPSRALKRHVVRLMERRGVACREEQVFITSGAQQGLSLVARLLLDAGSPVLTEELTYSGFRQAVEPFAPELLTVPTDLETGIDTEAVERLLRGGARPRLIYTVPDGHNPLGVSVSREKRSHLAALARRYGVPVVEDDPYGLLNYDGSPPPPMRALDDRWVFYVGSFSKILAPAVRAGWVVAPEELMPHLSIIKESSDIDTATLSQRAVARYLDADPLDAHLATLCKEYGRRRDLLVGALRRHFPEDARWTTPSNGVFVWVELADGVDTQELLRAAIREEHIAFLPGSAFTAAGTGRSASNCMRLNFSHTPPERIEDGIARLGRLLRAARAGATVGLDRVG
jgi:2-aminoadipate transaminase